MTPAAQCASVIDILKPILEAQKPADRVAQAYFKNHRFVGSHDRNAITSLLYGIIRHYHRLSWHIHRAQVELTPRTLLLAYMALVAARPAGMITALYSGEQHSPAPLGDAENGLLKRLAGQQLEQSTIPDAVRYECPDWLEATLLSRYGDDFVPLLASLRHEAGVDVRINPLRWTREEALRELSGLKLSTTKLSPLGMRAQARFAYNQIAALQDGRLEIQDESSQICGLLVDAEPGMAVVDLCAGAGGKTLLLAALMQNKGRLVASDVNDKRLAQCEKRLKKAGVQNTQVRLADKRWRENNAAKFDRVLIDAPCTGSGTWRRNPDARLRYNAVDLAEMVTVQRDLLRQGQKLVKPGGRLVYSTCSLLDAENEAQMAWFAGEYPGFVAEPLAPIAEKQGLTGLALGQGAHSLQLLPHTHGTDGFFVSVWRRSDA
ncbi:MAG: RsmB/NOP family class I SAM-dependent RNA methyltransferase [Alphaproteobacteria bacterium]|nr:RsmB/NOP family class I SAM-dependent RNA methyltransferase [Alphaproteobacteria bacterium]